MEGWGGWTSSIHGRLMKHDIQNFGWEASREDRANIDGRIILN